MTYFSKILYESHSRFLFLLVCLTFVFGNSIYCQKKVVGYYPYWYKTSYSANSIDYKSLTHINHAFIWPNSNGTLNIPSNINHPELISLAHDAGVKVLISIGGWGETQTKGFVDMTADTAIRKVFINALVNFITLKGYDGADLDWEFPANTTQKNLYTALVTELREALDAVNPNLLLTMASPASGYSGQHFDFAKTIQHFDWINLMGYDFHGSWTPHAGHNSPLLKHPNDSDGSIQEGVNYLYLQRNIPKDKIVVGVPFYGKEFNAAGLYAQQTGTVTDLLYKDIVPRLNNNGWIYYWDSISLVPYLMNSTNTKFVTFDDTVSIRLKCEYVVNNSLGGIMIWALGQDYINGQTPLLTTIGKSFGTTSVEILPEQELAANYILYDNYPNPFNPSTVIRFYVPHEGLVVIKVFNTLGQEVAEIFNKEISQGTYEVTFNASALSSGVYFYSLITNKNIITKKMILIR